MRDVGQTGRMHAIIYKVLYQLEINECILEMRLRNEALWATFVGYKS